jgi:hypothetical protein
MNIRSWLTALLAVALTSCTTLGAGGVVAGPDPIPGQGFRFVGHISGDFDGQALAYEVPLTALVKVHGNATITARAYPPPYLVVDGDLNTIVEPVPMKESEAIAAVRRGDILIRRSGMPGALNPQGSIRGYKSALMQRYSSPPPPPPPMPNPTSSKTVGCVMPEVCTGPECCVPPFSIDP